MSNLKLNTPRGLFTNIKEVGLTTYKHSQKYVSEHLKLSSLINRRIFLLQCKNHNIIPKHIINNIKNIFTLQLDKHPFTNLVDSTLQSFRRKILKLEIKITIWKIKTLRESIRSTLCYLKENLNTTIYNELVTFTKKKYNYKFKKIKETNLKKFEDLKKTQTLPDLTFNEDYIKNYTNIDIPDEVQKIISLGPKHGLEPNELPIKTIIKDVEHLISQQRIETEEKNRLRSQLNNIITIQRNKMLKNRKKIKNPIVDYIKQTSRFINNHKEDIIICKADKGNKTVVMDKLEYIEETKKMLLDKKTYEKMDKDPTSRLERKSNAIIKKLKDNNDIVEIEYRNLIRHNSVTPKLYCLRKTHKENLNLRPVVSNINSPGYNIGKLIHNILNAVNSTNNYNVKNSFELIETIKDLVIPDNYTIISLDVVSLFTNIPQKLVIDIIKRKWNYIKNFTNISKDAFLQLIDFTFETSYFSFQNIFYKQIDGTPMGAPASPAIANFIMNHLFDTVLGQLKEKEIEILLAKLYVDDTFLVVPKDHIDTILNTFNNFHNNIQFTIELPKNNKIPFLDVLIILENNRILTNWYTKPSNTDRIINYKSNHSLLQKFNIIKNLLDRAIKLSHSKFHIDNLSKVKNILYKNNYPKYLVTQYINKYLDKNRQNPGNNDKNNNINCIFFKIPYIKGFTEKINKVVTKFNCKIATYNINTVKTFYTRLKDITPKEQQSYVVYKIPCTNCDKCYIGQTSQLLKNRIKQHINDCRYNIDTQFNKTAVTAHYFKDEHKWDFQNVTILDHETNHFKRLISEMIHIRSNNTVNFKEDIEKLSCVYDNLLINNCY